VGTGGGATQAGAGGGSAGGGAGAAPATGCQLALSDLTATNVDAEAATAKETTTLGASYGAHGTFLGTSKLNVTVGVMNVYRLVVLNADFATRTAGATSPIVQTPSAGQSLLNFRQDPTDSGAFQKWVAQSGTVTLMSVGPTDATFSAQAMMSPDETTGAKGTFTITLSCSLASVAVP
jgi:hypothetical protein